MVVNEVGGGCAAGPGPDAYAAKARGGARLRVMFMDMTPTLTHLRSKTQSSTLRRTSDLLGLSKIPHHLNL